MFAPACLTGSRRRLTISSHAATEDTHLVSSYRFHLPGRGVLPVQNDIRERTMKKTLLVIGSAAAGAALAYLFDPDRGRSRRAQLSDQAKSQLRDASETVRAQADYQAGVAKGAFHEAASSVEPEREFGDDTLLQKVRSEALGHFSSEASVEVSATEGIVKVSGSVPSAEAREQLLEMIRDVEGVDRVEDHLTVVASVG